MNYKIEPRKWLSNQLETQAAAFVETKENGFRLFKDGVIEKDIVHVSCLALPTGGLKIQLFPLNVPNEIRMMNPEVYIYPTGKISVVTSEKTHVPPELFGKYWSFSPFGFLKTIVEVEKAFLTKNPAYVPWAENLFFQRGLTHFPVTAKLSHAEMYYYFGSKVF